MSVIVQCGSGKCAEGAVVPTKQGFSECEVIPDVSAPLKVMPLPEGLRGVADEVPMIGFYQVAGPRRCWSVDDGGIVPVCKSQDFSVTAFQIAGEQSFKGVALALGDRGQGASVKSAARAYKGYAIGAFVLLILIGGVVNQVLKRKKSR